MHLQFILSGIVSGDAPLSYWPIFSLSLVTVPEAFAKGNLAQFPSQSGEIQHGSIKVSEKLPTYPSPKPTFCPKREVSVNGSLGEG